MRGHDTGLDYHRVLLGDASRVDAYDRAIRALVKRGDVVLDLGAGTGLLAMLAARQGARVHAVESMPVARLARLLVAHNGLQEQVTVHESDVREMQPVEPVDWVLGEWMGRYVVDDEMLEAVAAAGRWLKPTGRFCPHRVTLKLAVAGDFELPMVDRFRDPLLGLSMEPALVASRQTCYAVALQPENLLGEARDFAVLEPPAVERRFDAELTLPIARDGEMVGLVGWFEAELAPGITLATTPGTHTHWGQYLFPLKRQVVKAGESVNVRLWLDGDDWHWQTSHGEGASAQWASIGAARDAGAGGDTPEAPGTAASNEAVLAGQQGLAAYQQGDVERAIQQTALATSLLEPEADPALVAALYENLGMALLAAGRYAAAEQALLRAVDGRREVPDQLRANLETARKYRG